MKRSRCGKTAETSAEEWEEEELLTKCSSRELAVPPPLLSLLDVNLL